MKAGKSKFFCRFLPAIFQRRTKKHFTSAIILAAGSSTRMGGETTKQWLEVNGIPTVVHSVLSFDASPHIDEIIISAKKDELPLYKQFKTKFAISKPISVICGGSTRQESSLNAFKYISDEAEFVAIHDAARCLITPKMIESVISAAYENGAACACCRSADTVKIVTKGDLVEQTPERKNVRLAQTPQVFQTEIYRVSAYKALADGIEVTDDASMAEHAGFAVKMVDCGRENIKITEPSDIPIAEAILDYRTNNS